MEQEDKEDDDENNYWSHNSGGSGSMEGSTGLGILGATTESYMSGKGGHIIMKDVLFLESDVYEPQPPRLLERPR
ncbi:hypothetical protein BBBOND_0212280 [Babesia bigemina]|uniref:Uncharacterized protein n=1 Tax=Babesia bigemina TaxID=5866 RepID=A0A061D5U1_BABBI|nr:hypothetical protein BBBOND_0212280 [Babesia bigemina]CDR96086.1 hypothetical protein BBBOND_0212280 [Babesia bigemina]|eukprot:XP_012768272.1 hypothetical protein BBBOND_0212280 [Babesia bigemina]